MATDMTVAKTILEQLGGNKFLAMTGAKNLVANEKALSFRLPGSGFAKDGINYVHIDLNWFDLYNVTFSRVRGKSVKHLHTVIDVEASLLRDVFTKATGLETSLGTMGRGRI